jgi:hypothetical protein
MDDGYIAVVKLEQQVPETRRDLEKTKIIQLHLVGYSYTYLEYDARNHEPKIHLPPIVRMA